MRYLQRRFALDDLDPVTVQSVLQSLDSWSPIVRRTRIAQVEAVVSEGRGAIESHEALDNFDNQQPRRHDRLILAEVLARQDQMVVVTLSEFPPHEDDPDRSRTRLELDFIGPSPTTDEFEQLVQEFSVALGSEIVNPFWPSRRYRELQEDGLESSPAPEDDELTGSVLLAGRSTRDVATAIKASGGLLESDLGKQVGRVDSDDVEGIVGQLVEAGLVEAETVILCSKTRSQVARLDSRDERDALTDSRLKCACGEPMASEPRETAFAVTDLGALLLDGNRWMSVLVQHELLDLGLRPEDIMLEQHVGADEIDCLANVNAELVLFELKDKEFSLGNAYSFGAKMGIIQPMHSVIITTEHVDGDVKEHFERSARASRDERRFRSSREVGPERSSVIYIEGLSDLRAVLESLVEPIMMQDAVRAVSRALDFAGLSASQLVEISTGSPLPPGVSEGPQRYF